MSNYGNRVQFQVYQSLKPGDLPVQVEEWERKAREVLQDGPYYYVAGGAGAEATMRSNRRAFDRWQIQPRMLRNIAERDLTVSILGQTFEYPILLAPIGVQSIIHPEGELASAKAAAAMGVTYITSTASTKSLEEVADVMGNAARWYQLYWSSDPEIAASMLQRAEKAGYSAIVVTLDTPMMAWREFDIKNAYLPFLMAEGIGNFLQDPVFRSKLQKPPEEDLQSAVMLWARVFGNPSLTWEDLSFLRQHTRLPILLKGILHPEDAKLAAEYGMDGIIVSNHGGRQVDGAVAALDALPKVCEAVDNRIPVLMDSGIRRGSDVIKALSLGAKAVLLGRPYAYGLAVAGEQGVKEVIRNLIADLDLTMALSGIKSVKEIDSSVIVKAP